MSSATGAARASSGARAAVASVSLQAVLRQVLDELATLIGTRHAVVEVIRTADNPQVRGTEPAVKQIVYHLLKNAVEASPNGGIVRVAQHERNGQVIFEVTDEGPGIGWADFSRILKRGFTTKAGAKGQGLADVEWRLAELRGGIAWESPHRTGRGACFTITLPAAAPVAPAP
ncbi:MAG TPA: HAMP domain-containing sensor histidine kinase [Patescibacteria group bacterium]|nr:HAMP domain-containing sensor histidine kinase [Patescibacteria group bacterium]